MLNDLIHRLRSLFRRHRVEQELDEELRFHLDQQIAAHVGQGLPAVEAARRAAIEFGAVPQIREEHRDARGIALVDDLARDIRHGVRQLHRSPGFALAALTCLALGIGAATTVYSVVDAIFIQPLPFRDADRLVRLYENVPAPVPGRPPTERGLVYREFPDWAQAKSLRGLAAFAGFGQRLVRTNTGSAGLWGVITSSNAFTMLGVRPLLGRTLVPGDERRDDVIVLSYDAWRRHFGGDATIVGRSFEFRLGALMPSAPPRLMTVVGVLPADFELPQNTSLELPRGTADFYQPMSSPVGGPPGRRVTTIARLATGATVTDAAEEVRAIGAAMRATTPANAQPSGPRQFQLEPLKERAVQPLRPAFRVLTAAVAVVLLIVCANVANLLLARGTSRHQELVLRVAIGASRGRLVRQLMTECLVLAIGGGALGALVGAAGVSLVKRLATLEAPGIFGLMFGSTILPRAHEVSIDVTVLGTALTLAVVTSVVFGVLPALHLSRAILGPAMSARGSSSGRRATRIRATLTVAQLTMATVLLVGAGLLARSFVILASVNNGYDATDVLAINLLFPNQYAIARKVETIDRLLARFREIPRAQSAGFSRHGLLIGEEIRWGTFVPPGRSLEEMKVERTRLRPVSDGFLTAMSVPIIDGREFGPADRSPGAPAIVMSRSAARQYFGAARAVGQVLDWYYADAAHIPVTVVGVVEDLRQLSPSDNTAPEIFVEYRQFLSLLDEGENAAPRQNALAIGFLSFALRTDGDPSTIGPLVRDIVNEIDPNIGIDALAPMTRLVSSAIAPQRFYAVLLGVFAAIAGVLAIIGIYSVLAYAVAQRTQEIGIRLSLGAPRAQVLTLVLRKGLLLTAIGIVLGSLGAVAASGLLRHMLFGITPLDVTTFAMVPLAFSLVAMAASYLPARRATRIDPIVALRQK
jgi:putative ABC transport system permease protein